MGTEAPADLGTIYGPIAADLRELDRFLRREFVSREPFIHEILEHIARFGGKQIRPALLFLSTRLVGGDRDVAGGSGTVGRDVIEIGAVLELVHTATLVHDDLLDGASMRRRVETVHARWGDRPAILIGDYIYSRAFELSTHVDGMAAVLSRTTHAICEGELLQIGCRRDPDVDEDTYFEIIRKKTAILHGVACRLGGVLAGLDATQSARLEEVGLQLGMAFQVIDDCLDYAGEEQVVGKSLGTDLRQGKPTLPLIYLRDELATRDPERARFLRRAIEGPIDEETERRVHDLVVQSDVLERSFARAEGFVDAALSALRGLAAEGIASSSAERESLELAAHYVLRRRS